MTGFNLVNYAARNADYVLIGATLGAGPLGQYTLAYRVMLYPLQSVSAVISRATFPAFAPTARRTTRLRPPLSAGRLDDRPHRVPDGLRGDGDQ